MIEPTDDRRKAVIKLLLIVALVALGYLCARTMRFANQWFNLAFQCGFWIMPFLAIKQVRRLNPWPKIFAGLVLTPVLAFASFALLATVSCDIPAAAKKIELSRELSSFSQGSYSIHLLDEETAGGAVGPHGLSLEQRMFILPGLYMVKSVAYFEDATQGNISAEEPDKVRLHIPKVGPQEEVDQVYTLKSKVYF